MKVFLFLYPIREYVEACLEQTFFSYKGHKPERLGQIINVRYRQRGYQVIWLLFSDPQAPSQPNLSQISDIFRISEKDSYLACGVTFAFHCSKEIYPDSDDIVKQLPQGIEELVVGGFHQWDCVDRIARCAYESGIPTRVDEDTTQFFFNVTTTEGQIPFIRRKSNLREGFARFGEHWVELASESRKDKPWFEQIT